VDVLTYEPVIPKGKWQQKMVKKLPVEQDEKIGDTNGKKGRILHLKYRDSQCSCQFKKKHSQGASFHGWNVPNELLIIPILQMQFSCLNIQEAIGYMQKM